MDRLSRSSASASSPQAGLQFQTLADHPMGSTSGSERTDSTREADFNTGTLLEVIKLALQPLKTSVENVLDQLQDQSSRLDKIEKMLFPMLLFSNSSPHNEDALNIARDFMKMFKFLPTDQEIGQAGREKFREFLTNEANLTTLRQFVSISLGIYFLEKRN